MTINCLAERRPQDARPAHVSGRAWLVFGCASLLISIGCAKAESENTAPSEQVIRTAEITDFVPPWGDSPQDTSDDAPPEANDPQDQLAQADPDAVPVEESAVGASESADEEEASESDAAKNALAAVEHPFPKRQPAPSLDGGVAWFNTSGPLDIKDLRGKFVLLDFWTYCCINCMHILPELKKLEHAYPNQLVVIGVHSAKFDTEKDTNNIREAILRYEIEHPVVNDANHRLWERYFVNSWPSLRVIDPEGNIVAGHGGEITFEDLDGFFKTALPYYRQKGTLDETPLRFDLEAAKARKTPLRFPGKVLADEAGKRLFIADSNHNRIVVTDLDGKLQQTIGSGAIGRADGDLTKAEFNHPQGMALRGETLYVADTENHLLRKVDLTKKQVDTIAGTGEQHRGGWPGMERGIDGPRDKWVGPPKRTGINSPWDLWIHNDDLYIAMAGPHQIWKMPLDEKELGPYAGNGREDIVDGPLLPRTPYEQGFSSFAQPSGLASDGDWLYVADSEGSSIRAVPLDGKGEVKTIVGTAHLFQGRLFTFGDVDGKGPKVRLQHALGVAWHEGQLYVADTYNNKIKVIDPENHTSKSIAGTGEAGLADGGPAKFDEPAGISYAAGKLFIADTNNHAIRAVDLANKNQVSTLTIEGLAPPAPAKSETADAKPKFRGAKEPKVAQQTVKPTDGKIALAVHLQLPKGWKVNPLAPQRYFVEVEGDAGPIVTEGLAKLVPVDPPSATFEVPLSVKGEGTATVKLSVEYFYCQEKSEGLCKTGAVIWTIPVKISDTAKLPNVPLRLKVD